METVSFQLTFQYAKINKSIQLKQEEAFYNLHATQKKLPNNILKKECTIYARNTLSASIIHSKPKFNCALPLFF